MTIWDMAFIVDSWSLAWSLATVTCLGYLVAVYSLLTFFVLIALVDWPLERCLAIRLLRQFNLGRQILLSSSIRQ